jgi:hypothetical protein
LTRQSFGRFGVFLFERLYCVHFVFISRAGTELFRQAFGV